MQLLTILGELAADNTALIFGSKRRIFGADMAIQLSQILEPISKSKLQSQCNGNRTMLLC